MIFAEQPSREVHLESITELQIIYFPARRIGQHTFYPESFADKQLKSPLSVMPLKELYNFTLCNLNWLSLDGVRYSSPYAAE